jgi:hypothetical protein
VVDEAGTPVADADVWFSPPELGIPVESDAHGSYVLPIREAAAHWLSARKGDTGIAVQGPLQLSPSSDFDAPDLVLRGAATLTGTVVYPDGTPVRRFAIHAVPEASKDEQIHSWPVTRLDTSKDPDAAAGLRWGWTRTDNDGRFALRGLRTGRYFFLEDRSRALFPTGGDDRVVIDAYRILVRVVDEADADVHGVGVAARSDRGSSTAGAVDEIATRPGETWTVSIGDREIVPASVTVAVVAPTREYEARLVARVATAFGRARVRLRDAAGNDVARPKVSLYAADGHNVIVLDHRSDEGVTPEVPAGRYHLEAKDADPFALSFPAEAPVDIRGGAITDVALRARPGGRARITLVRGEGAPATPGPARVMATPAGGGEAVSLARLARTARGYEVGGAWEYGAPTFGWHRLEPGSYDLRASAGGCTGTAAPVLIRAGEITDVEIVLTPE